MTPAEIIAAAGAAVSGSLTALASLIWALRARR